MSEQIIVYPCPYCSNLVYFDKPEELAYHIYSDSEHLKQALKILAKNCREVAKRKDMKWCLNEN